MSAVVVLVEIDDEVVAVGPLLREAEIDRIRELAEAAGGTARGQSRRMSVADFKAWMKSRGAA